MLWYMLAVVYVVLHRWLPQASWQAPLQLTLDLVIITGVVYATVPRTAISFPSICSPS